MSPRRPPAVRRRAATRRSIKTVVVRQTEELPQLPDTPPLDEEGVDGGLGEEIGLDAPWQRDGVPEQTVEAPITEEPSRRESTAVGDDEDTTRTERMIRLYLQEAGTVPLLTAADEVRLAEQLHTAKAHLLEALQAALPAVAIPPELTPEAWLAEQTRTVRLPVHVSERLGQLNRAAQRLRQALEREPTAPELASASQRSVEQVRALQTGTMPMMSLDTPIADGQSQLRDVIAERTFRNPLDTAIKMELSDHVMSCMQALTPREAYIVRARFGLDTGGGRTLEDIGQALQLSRERVRQLEAHALEKLRHAFCHRQRRSFLEN